MNLITHGSLHHQATPHISITTTTNHPQQARHTHPLRSSTVMIPSPVRSSLLNAFMTISLRVLVIGGYRDMCQARVQWNRTNVPALYTLV